MTNSSGPGLPDLISMLTTLIEHPSISSTDPKDDRSNLEVIHILAEWLETLHFDVRILPVSKSKSNLVATLGRHRAGSGLVLSGHTDTVPYDEERWSCDPFQLTEKDQRLYGLGSADMKSFFGIALEAVRIFDVKQFETPLVIVATADEESTMAGAKRLLDEGIQPGRYALIGEPTSLKPVRMHKGVMMESIRVRGESGHSSNPALGASALEGMHRVLAELLRWRRELQQSNRNPMFEVDVPTVNLGAIRGGDSPNRICAQCETLIDIRPLPGMDLKELRESLNHRLQSVLADEPRLSLTIDSLFEGIPAFETDPDSAFLRTCESLTGHPAQAVAFGTEAPYFSRLGMETVILGPGSIDQAHQPDEYLPMKQIKPAIELIRNLIRRYCLLH
ncbi:MAG: acetylornithine deacetylase [Methylococcaceae bacterium]|nr:acetylornithine deacetylase [Methylococcaceae bacterium]MCI0734494.1 acetylornithine deacetylase [Methylococcaceae bacterium]